MSPASRSSMLPNEEGSRKRKLKEVGESSNAAEPQLTKNLIDALLVPAHVIPSGAPEHIAPDTRPFSYQHLLMDAPDPEGYLRSFDRSGNSQPNDQSRAQHGETMRNELAGIVATIAEKTEKKLKELELESHLKTFHKGHLERMKPIYRMQAEGLENRLKGLKQEANTLRKLIKTLDEFRRMQAAAAPKDAESHYVEPVELEHVRLDCVTCKSQVATMMMIMCQHLCVCKQCESSIDDCPVCGIPKLGSLEVLLPYD